MPIKQFAPVSKQRIPPISYLPFGGASREGAERTFAANIRTLLRADVHVLPLGRARAGIYLLVKHAVRGSRRKVIMSPYTITDVVKMVTLGGGEPVFVDFLPGSTACDVAHLQSLAGADTACVIITHYHVSEPRLAAIAAICREHGAALFDDCALAFGGAADGRAIGTATDASVFSFSSFKTLNFFWGGAIVTGNADTARELRELMRDWVPLGGADYIKPAKVCLRYDLAARPWPFRYLTFPLLRRRASASGAVA